MTIETTARAFRGVGGGGGEGGGEGDDHREHCSCFLRGDIIRDDDWLKLLRNYQTRTLCSTAVYGHGFLTLPEQGHNSSVF